MTSTRVDTEAILKGKIRKDFAWKIISDFSQYSEIMDSVDRVKIHEKDNSQGRSEWFVTVEEAPLNWMEKDYYDHQNYELRFESIDGDFESIHGFWRVEDYKNEGIKIEFHIDYSLGIPVIEEVLGDILKEKMKKNIDSMIHAIKTKLSSQEVEERESDRIPINCYNNLKLNEKEIRAYIVNISTKGILFYYDGDFDSLSVNLIFGKHHIEGEELFNDLKHKNTRIVFNTPLSKSVLEEIIFYLRNQNLRLMNRKTFDCDLSIEIFNNPYKVQLKNISPQGMFFKYSEDDILFSNTFSIRGVPIPIEHIDHNVPQKEVRIVFKSKLNTEFFNSLIQSMN